MATATAMWTCWSPRVLSQVIMWINDGYDFVHSDTFVLDSEEGLIFSWLPTVDNPSAKPRACCGMDPA